MNVSTFVCQIIWCSIQTISHLVLVIYLAKMLKLLLHNNCALFSRGHDFTHNSMWQRVDSHEEVHEVLFEIGSSSCAVTFTAIQQILHTNYNQFISEQIIRIFCETKKKFPHRFCNWFKLVVLAGRTQKTVLNTN